MDWELVGFVQGSKYRKICLQSLSDSPKTPTEIADSNDIRIEYVSRSLSELSDKSLVECKTPELRKGRIYQITEKGVNLVKEMKKKEIF